MNASEQNELSRIEAVLFLSREPLASRKIAQLADVADGTLVRALIRRLNDRYRKNKSAFYVYEVAGGFQLRTAPEFAPWLLRLQEAPIEPRLTNSALETLSIVAYEQPILRANIEQIRGVHCGDVLRQLLEQNLVKIVGRSEELGRPFLYGTTKKFLQTFGLMRIEDLPHREKAWISHKDTQDGAEQMLDANKNEKK